MSENQQQEAGPRRDWIARWVQHRDEAAARALMDRMLANQSAGIARARAGAPGEGGPAAAGGGAGRAFRPRDANGDGKLDREELPGAFFDRLDTNKYGFVTGDELKSLWKAITADGATP